MQLFCKKCEEPQDDFRFRMPAAVMITDVKGTGEFKVVDTTELRDIGECLKTATCKTCGSVLDFIPDEFAEARKEETVDAVIDTDFFGAGSL